MAALATRLHTQINRQALLSVQRHNHSEDPRGPPHRTMRITKNPRDNVLYTLSRNGTISRIAIPGPDERTPFAVAVGRVDPATGDRNWTNFYRAADAFRYVDGQFLPARYTEPFVAPAPTGLSVGFTRIAPPLLDDARRNF